MGQIVSTAAKPKRCNANQLSQLGVLAAGLHVLVSSDNSMNANGQGNFDCYVVGDGQTTAMMLELRSIADRFPVAGGKNAVASDSLYKNIQTSEYISVPYEGTLDAEVTDKIRESTTRKTYFLPVRGGDNICVKAEFSENYFRGGFTTEYPKIGVTAIDRASWDTSMSQCEISYYALQDGYFCFSIPTAGSVISINLRNNYLGGVLSSAIADKVPFVEMDMSAATEYSDVYIRYSDGMKATVGTASAFKVWVISCAGIKRIKAKVGCGNCIPAAVAFYSSEVDMSASAIGTYMQGNSIQIKAGIAEYTADVPDGALYVAITNRGATCATPSVVFLKDPFYDIDSNIEKLGIEKVSYREVDGTATENVLENVYIRYDDGAKANAGTGAQFKTFYFPCEGIGKIEAELAATDGIPAAIAFYSGQIDVNTTAVGTYMKDASVQFVAGTHKYVVAVPDGASYVFITNKYYTLSTPTITLLKNPFYKDSADNILMSREEEAVDTVISDRVFVGNLPAGTQFVLDVTEYEGSSIASITFYNGIAWAQSVARNKILINSIGSIYFEIEEGVHWISVRKESATGNVLNYELKETDTYPIRSRIQGFYLPVSNTEIDLGEAFVGYYMNEYNIYKDVAWLSFKLQKSCGYTLAINATELETYYIDFNLWDTTFSQKMAFHITDATTEFDLSNASGWNIQIRRIDRGAITVDDIEGILSVTYVSGTIYERPMLKNDVEKIIDEKASEDVALKVAREGYSLHLFSNAPHYYHFRANDFVKDGAGNKAIASESIEDVALAARLGFAFIEANIQPTSDGKYVCIHGSSGGTFGPEVKSLNENVITTEALRSTAINSVTQAWIRENVRYDSYYAKYQTSIPTLEEFCEACKENNIGIFAGTNQKSAIETCIKYLGNNVIVYGAPSDVRDYFNGYVLHWNNSSGLTISNLLSRAKSFGAPYICSLGPTTIAEFENNSILDNFVSTMHANGFLCGFAGVYQTEDETRDLIRRGFDMNGSGHEVNSFDSNYEEFDVDDANHLPTTTGNISNGVVTLASGQTITCGSSNVISVGKGNLFIRFNGTLNINFGSQGNRSGLVSDGTQMLNISDYFFGRSTQLIITAGANTTITHFVYKTSRC